MPQLSLHIEESAKWFSANGRYPFAGAGCAVQ